MATTGDPGNTAQGGRSPPSTRNTSAEFEHVDEEEPLSDWAWNHDYGDVQLPLDAYVDSQDGIPMYAYELRRLSLIHISEPTRPY